MNEVDGKSVELVAEKEKIYVFKKIWKLFGVPVLTFERTVNEEEFADTISKKVMGMINAELQQRFAPPRRKS